MNKNIIFSPATKAKINYGREVRQQKSFPCFNLRIPAEVHVFINDVFFYISDATNYAHYVFNTMKQKQTGKISFEVSH